MGGLRPTLTRDPELLRIRNNIKTFKISVKCTRQPDRYESHLDLSCDPEDVIGNRILSVVGYLRRIQEK